MNNEQKIAIEQEQSQTCLDSAECEQIRAERKQQTRERIGQRIKALRTEQKLTQGELAERARLQLTHISRIEAGKYSVGIDTLSAIANVLGKQLDFVEQ